MDNGLPPPVKDEDACTSERQSGFFKGAIVHTPGHCKRGWISELVHQYGGTDGNEGVWRAVNDAGIVHGVAENTGHVICGDEDALWVLELHVTDPNEWWPDLPDRLRDLFDDDRQAWALLMKPRNLDTAMEWAKKKTEEGLIVRIRNIRTGDIIMGVILGQLGEPVKVNTAGPRRKVTWR